MLKYLIVLAATFAVISAEATPALTESSKKFNDTLNKCIKTHNVTEAQLKTLMDDNFQLLKADKNVQCAYACWAKELDITKSDNTFDKTKLLNVLKPVFDYYKESSQKEKENKLNELIDMCITTQRVLPDACSTTCSDIMCIFKNAQRNELLPNQRNFK